MAEDFNQQGSGSLGSPGGPAVPSTGSPEAPGQLPTSGAPGAPPSPEPVHELKWKGQTHKLPLQKVIELAQQGFDYTQGKQALAAKEREYQTQLQNYQRAIGEVRQFLSDRAKVKAYYDAMAGGSGAAAADPDQILTAQQAQELMQRQAESQRSEFAKALTQLREEISLNVRAGSYTEKIDQAISGLVSKHPELKVLPNVGRDLKEEAAQMNPGTLEEAIQLVADAAARRAEGVRAFFAEQQKATAAGQQPLSRGIEPPANGAAPPPAPSAPTPKNFNSKEFRDLVMSDLQAAFKQG